MHANEIIVHVRWCAVQQGNQMQEILYYNYYV